MNTDIHYLDITLNGTDTSLQRLVGVIRRRDFRIVSLHATEEQPGVQRVRAAISGTRSPETLVKHLLNLVDVRSATIEPTIAPNLSHTVDLLNSVDPPRLR